MKVKKLFGTLVLMLFCIAFARSQEKTITGTIIDQTGIPLPGVNIVVDGTTNGTQSDFDGNYSIVASVGQTLVYTYLGQRPARRLVGAQSVIDIQMEEDAQALEEVVVTALGIKREKQALGYAVAEVSSEQLEEKAEGDLGRVLIGKASGVNITQQSGLSGSGTNIVIRGYNSFSQSNQPLFIVDGVPFNGDTNSSGRQGSRQDFINGNNGSSRFLDLDPNSIESVNVLKGLAASTLYGSLGRNGVILITTKAGSGGQGAKKTEITVNSSLFFNEIASTPEYQNQFGNGFDQSFGWFFSNWGPSFDRDGISGWGNSTAFDANGTLPHPYSISAAGQQAFPEFANARYEWRPYDSFGDFFKTGTVTNLSINASGSSDDGKVSYNANYGHLKDIGFTPGNSLNRNNFGIGGRAVLSNKFTISGALNFARTKFISPPVALSQGNGATGSGSSVFGDLFFTPRSIDVVGLPFQSPIDGSSIYYRNGNDIQHPLWTANNAGTRQETNRVFGNMGIQYQFNDNLNLIYRVGIDVYSENNVNFQNKGGINGNVPQPRLASGIYETWNNTNTIWDHNIAFNGDYDITEKVGTTFNVGVNGRREIFDQNGIASDAQQVFGVLRHFNFLNQNEIQQTSERNLVGFYGQVELDYDNYVYLTLAGRNDWVSNLSTANRSLFYPSASVSFVPTKAFDGLKSENVLNYLKIRAGYGTSAGFPDANSDNFPVSNRLVLDTQDFQDATGTNVVTNTSPLTLGNPDLKPEQVSEIELGVETRWWDGRITLDASVYERTTTDLIVQQPLDPSSGFFRTNTNVGEIKGEGIEIDLGLNFFRSAEEGGFDWSTNINFTANESEVTDLGQETDLIVYSGFGNLGNAAIEGQPLGVIYGTRILRDANGQFVVNSIGDFVQDPQDGVIGDPNPDFVANINNTFSYKNFSFGFQFNWTQGGDIWSSTISTLLGRGLIVETLDRENTFVLPGVQSDGRVNDVQINNSDYFFNNILGTISELQVFDATVLRLQEVTLGYSLPKKYLKDTPFGALSFTVSGFNLWYDAINTPNGANFDPNTSGTGVGNGFGFDFLNGPSSRRYGFSVKATF
ncbi:SusC/RagA family TonB-linked outer membrane protein [Flagellimonas hymeniacidonis]|uniref:SusC/RagA family TonB-linked outer membrane protein n=1 Tax=Flagellimonas hymeniacidonis TaxID=2603628 RepID=A0A5C8V1T5_9FLAO|nr:SusC/RagA family TonB-linked outer membrane protein [Flagellimonas hymeniacidonis]TXN34718.1 SusC/RagA family TonB-linked outer membrane protein [Flagellimonas hymeniacidonis]